MAESKLGVRVLYCGVADAMWHRLQKWAIDTPLRAKANTKARIAGRSCEID